MKNLVVSLILTIALPVMILAADTEQDHPRTGLSTAPEAKALAEQIVKMEYARIEAGVRKDVAALAAVTADDYVQIDWQGKRLDKAATLARIESSRIQLQSNELNDLSVRIYGDTIIVVGTATRKGTMDGNDVSGAIRYSRVYVKLDGRWQAVSFQQTRVVE